MPNAVAILGARRRRLRRRPSRAERRARSVRPPVGVALELQRTYRQLFAELGRRTLELLGPVLAEAVAMPGELVSEPFHLDQAPESVRARLSALELAMQRIFDTGPIDETLERVAGRVDRRAFRQLREVIGVAVRQADPGIAAHVDRFRAMNVSRVRSIAGEALVELTQLLEGADVVGMRVEDLAQRIGERFEVSSSRAELLARDQVLTLNAQIARQRATSAGLTRYVWTTSSDERVRETHAELDGTEQRYDTPPVVSDDGRRAHPGEDYQCRCTCAPIIEAAG